MFHAGAGPHSQPPRLDARAGQEKVQKDKAGRPIIMKAGAGAGHEGGAPPGGRRTPSGHNLMMNPAPYGGEDPSQHSVQVQPCAPEGHHPAAPEPLQKPPKTPSQPPSPPTDPLQRQSTGGQPPPVPQPRPCTAAGHVHRRSLSPAHPFCPPPSCARRTTKFPFSPRAKLGGFGLLRNGGKKYRANSNILPKYLIPECFFLSAKKNKKGRNFK